jgi:hypothetical protein
MSNLETGQAGGFVKPKQRYKRLWSWLHLVVTTALVCIGIIQTQWFVSLLPHPSIDTIRDHIAKCQGLQKEARDHCCKESSQPIQSGIIFKLFSDNQKRHLEAARDILLNDEALDNELRQKFKISLRDLNVVVVPAWQMDTTDNNQLIGISDQGWRDANVAKGEPDVGGCTLRERPGFSAITDDGRPRIVLNPKAFEKDRTIRLTLFHELLHAMNVPGYYPSKLTFAQNDLTYLPEYRAYVRQHQLDGWYQYNVLLFGVGVPLLLFLLVLRGHLKAGQKDFKIATVETETTHAGD